MIDRSISDLFPPYWLTATDDTTLWWACPFPQPEEVTALARFAALREDGGFDDLGTVGQQPNANGSFIRVDGSGVTLHLTAPDKAALAPRGALFALMVDGGGVSDEVAGQVAVSDWAARPHAGTA